MGNDTSTTLNSEQIRQGRAKISELQSQLEIIRNELYVKNHENARLRVQVANNASSSERLSSDRIKLQQNEIQLDQLRNEIAELRFTKSKVSQELDELNRGKSTMVSKVQDLQAEKDDLSNLVDDLKKEVNNKLFQIDEFSKKIADNKMIGVWSPKTLTYTITSLTPSPANLIFDCDQTEFNIIKQQFMKTTQPHFQVHKVQKISNPHLRAMKMLCEKQHEILHGRPAMKQMLLYRGFKMSCQELAETGFAQAIQKYGFIKFSTVSNHECHKSQLIGDYKCMVVSSVIACLKCQHQPPTPIGNSADYGKVSPRFVNIYQEDMAYPEYLLYFTGETIIKPKPAKVYVNSRSSSISSSDQY